MTVRKLARVGALGSLGLVTVAIAVAGCTSTGGDKTSAQRKTDRSIARGVDRALAADPIFKYSNVKADVQDGNIQLTGFVATPQQRQRAAEVASHVKNARQVINDIVLAPAPTGRVTIRDPMAQGGSTDEETSPK